MQGETLTYADNQVICRQGDRADRMFILRGGKIELRINPGIPHPNEDTIRSDGVKIGTADEPGHVVGDAASFLKHHAASLLAVGPVTAVECVPIPEGGIAAGILRRPQLGLTLCRGLAEQLREVSSTVTPVATRSEMIQRESERFALEFAKLVEEIRALATQLTTYGPLADELEATALYQTGHMLSRERYSTCVFFTDEAARRPAGTRQLAIGDTLIEENAPGREVFLLRDGELDVLRKDTVIGKIKAGEMVGELAILRKNHPVRTATVIARKTSTVMAIRGVEFLEKALHNPAILMALARTLARRVEATYQLFAQSLKTCDSETLFRLEDGSTYADTFRTLLSKVENDECLAVIRRNALDSFARLVSSIEQASADATRAHHPAR